MSPDVPDAGTDGVLVLGPDPVRARWWAGWSLLLVALTLVLAIASGGGVIEWIAVAVAMAVALYFVIPVASPATTTLVFDARGVRGRMYHVPVAVDWDPVQVARVVRVVGEPVLELHVREPSPQGDPWRTRAFGVLLPIGADLDALQTFLDGRSGLRRRT
ncbi:MAG: hypothetical protein KY461_03040 [Actinobacteria bacterium]|nr:hypothetical protein [Actinomycetota bacterium]